MKRLFALTMVLLMILSCVCGCKNAPEEKAPETTTPTTDQEDIPAESDPDESLVRADFASYESIIKTYEKIAQICFEYDDEETYYDMFCIPGETEREWFDALLKSTYLVLPKSGRIQYDCSLGYALKDLNENGSDELILLYSGYDSKVVAIFSIFNGKPILLDHYWDRYECNISCEGDLFVRGSSGAAMTSFSRYVISEDDSHLELISEYGTTGFDESNNTLYYNVVNGEKVNITESEYENLDNQRVKDFKRWEFEYVYVAKKSKDISSALLSKKLGCAVSTRNDGNIDELMGERSKRIFATSKKDGDKYKLIITVHNDGYDTTRTVMLSKPFLHADLVDLYCGFTSETDGYVLVFYQDEPSLGGGDPTELVYILKTTDAGQTWTVIEYSNPQKVSAREYIVFAYFFDEKTGIFSARYYFVDEMWARTRITLDGGDSWQCISPLPAPPINEVLGIEHYQQISSIELVNGKYVMTVFIGYGESRTVDGGHGFYIKFISDDLKSWELM